MNRPAFSLLELCIAVAILGIITLVAALSLSPMRARAHARECRAHLQALSLAVQTYATECQLPPGALIHFTNLYPRFWSMPSPGRCPSTGLEYPRIYTNGSPVFCPALATHPDHLWTPLSSPW